MQFVLVFCLAGTGQGAEQAFTLEEIINLALETNPQIEVARQQYNATQGVLTQSRSAYLPHLNAGLNAGKVHVDDVDPDESGTIDVLLSANQLIYDFGKTTGLISASKFKVKADEEVLKQTIHDTVFQVKSAFYLVLEKEQLIEVAEQAVSNYKQQFERAREFFETGARTKLDVTNAEVNLSQQQLNLVRAQSELKVAEVQLEKVIGVKPVSGQYKLIFETPSVDNMLEGLPRMPGPLDDLILQAESNRPGLQQYSYLVEAATSNIKRARGDYFPSINLVGSYEDYDTDIPILYDQWLVGIGFNWKLFSGFETRGKVAEAKAKLYKIKAQLTEMKLLVTQDVTDSLLKAEENYKGIHIATQGFKLATDYLDMADVRYNTGIGDVLEFNEAQLLYTESQSNLIINYFNYLIALASIDRATGQLPANLENEQLDR